jgi:ATP-dependent DNA helicase RecQ
MKKSTIAHVNEPGLALCNYFEEGWGSLVRQGRDQDHFTDDLVAAAADALRNHLKTLNEPPTIVVPVPSLRRPTLVPNLAKRLADLLNLRFVPAVEHKVQHPAQADMRNSYQQASNVLDKYQVSTKLNGASILLVDDFADSRWTLTVVGELLQRNGSGAVFPFVLAATNVSD